MNPLVSIITPTYNHSAFIGACIESAQEQSYPNWEMVVVDDGSTDETAEIARKYAASDGRIQVFSRENVGIFRLSETYNFGISKSSGALIAVLEGDDAWEPKKLELQVAAFAENPDAILSWADFTIMSADLRPIGRSRSADRQADKTMFNNRPVGSILNLIYLRNIVAATTLVIRREELEAIGGFRQPDDLPLVDFPTILELATMGPFAYVGQPLAKWRWHADQVTKSYYSQIIERVRDVALEHFDRLDAGVRENLSLTRDEIEDDFRHQIHESYVRAGRYKLVQKRFSDARSDYRRALFYPGLSRPWLRLGALAGIGSSLFRMDLEWIARLLGKSEVS